MQNKVFPAQEELFLEYKTPFIVREQDDGFANFVIEKMLMSSRGKLISCWKGTIFELASCRT